MEAPKIAGSKPVITELEPGKFKWRTCGYSHEQPFYDHAHRDTNTGLKSTRFELTEKMTVALCMGKQTKNPLFCDGSHKILRKVSRPTLTGSKHFSFAYPRSKLSYLPVPQKR